MRIEAVKSLVFCIFPIFQLEESVSKLNQETSSRIDLELKLEQNCEELSGLKVKVRHKWYIFRRISPIYESRGRKKVFCCSQVVLAAAEFKKLSCHHKGHLKA